MKFSRSWLLLLTLWFALLQTVAPLMHAHAVAEDDADDGPHMHMVSVAAVEASDSDHAQPFHWHVHASKAEGTVIGLGQAITEKNWLQSLIDLSSDALLAVILPLALWLALQRLAASPSYPNASAQPLPALCLSTRHPPRAPPLA